MLVPAFQLYLQERVHGGKAAVGRFDGEAYSVACATHAGKVFIHSPHAAAQQPGPQVTYLNINKQITALAAGNLDGSSAKDLLLIGTPSSVQCYDVHLNRDLFYKDVPDGVNCLAVGRFGTYTKPLVIVGGNCCVQGFDLQGKEVFWTVTGDNVSAIALADIDEDGRNELLVGSDDFDIRVFKDEDVVLEIPEADQVVALQHLQGPRFAYALRNGTIGVYAGAGRAWRVKSKHAVNAVAAFDLDGDGVPELVSGWSNGKVEVRALLTGEVVARDSLGAAVAGLMVGDLRGMGAGELMAVSLEGELRGYQMQDRAAQVEVGDVAQQQGLLAALVQKKQELALELAAYRPVAGAATLLQSAKASGGGSSHDVAAIIPPGTRVDSCIALNRANTSCELTLRTNNDTVIKAAVVFGEQVFPGESLLVVPSEPGGVLTCRVQPARDAAVMLLIKALVGSRTSNVYQVFELEMELPKFAMYAVVERLQQLPSSHVTFQVAAPLHRLASWIEHRFTVKATLPRPDALEAYFNCFRDRAPLAIKAAPAAAGPAGSSLQVWIYTESMDMAGELVQDLAGHLGLEEVASACHFPAILDGFKSTLDQVEGYAATRAALAADVADSTVVLKQLVVRAEDARLLGNMPAMKRAYRQLYDTNRDLIAEHEKRAQNHAELLECLRNVNKMIQRAGRLHVGAPQSRVIAACRAAVKANNVQAIARIVREGA